MKTYTRQEYEDICKEKEKRGIGGSHVTGLMAPNKYQSPYKIWKESLYGRNEEEYSQAAKRGMALENYIADDFAKLHPEYKVNILDGLAYHKDYWWMVSQVDRLLTTKDNKLHLLEIKTTNDMNAKIWDNGIPIHYYWQVIHALNVTKADKAIIFAMVGMDNPYQEYVIDSQDEQVQRDMTKLLDTVVDFWNFHIERGIAPEIDGSEATSKSIDSLAKKEEFVNHNVDIDKLGDEIKALESQKKLVEEEIDTRKNKLKQAMGTFGKITSDKYSVSYSQCTTSSFNSKKFKEDHPNLYSTYTSTTTYSRFTITERKKKNV